MSNKGISIEIINKEERCVVCNKEIERLSVIYYAFLYRGTQSSSSGYICSSQCLAKTKKQAKRDGECHSSQKKYKQGDIVYYIPTKTRNSTVILSSEVGDKWASLSEEDKIEEVRKNGTSHSKLRLKEKEGDPKVLAYQEKKKKKEEKYTNPIEDDLINQKWRFLYSRELTNQDKDQFYKYRDSESDLCVNCWIYSFSYRLKEIRQKKLESMSKLRKYVNRCFLSYNKIDEILSISKVKYEEEELCRFLNSNPLFWEVEFNKFKKDFGCKDINLWITDPCPVKRALAKIIHHNKLANGLNDETKGVLPRWNIL